MRLNKIPTFAFSSAQGVQASESQLTFLSACVLNRNLFSFYTYAHIYYLIEPRLKQYKKRQIGMVMSFLPTALAKKMMRIFLRFPQLLHIKLLLCPLGNSTNSLKFLI